MVLIRFYAEIIKEKVLIERSTRVKQPAHRIILYPSVKLVNLLPVDMQYVLAGEKGIVKAGQQAAFTHVRNFGTKFSTNCGLLQLINFQVDPDETVHLEIRLENFKTCSDVIIPLGATDFSCRLKLEDSKQRHLYLTAEIHVNRGARFKVNHFRSSKLNGTEFLCLQINVFVPFWIINKTGIPLVFKQSGTSNEGAGQFDEHEQARMVTPLLFSFNDHDASNSIIARVGKRVVWDGTPQVSCQLVQIECVLNSFPS